MSVRHNAIFSKQGVLMGGLTLVPRYEMQLSNHQGLPDKHLQGFIARRKS